MCRLLPSSRETHLNGAADVVAVLALSSWMMIRQQQVESMLSSTIFELEIGNIQTKFCWFHSCRLHCNLFTTFNRWQKQFFIWIQQSQKYYVQYMFTCLHCWCMVLYLLTKKVVSSGAVSQKRFTHMQIANGGIVTFHKRLLLVNCRYIREDSHANASLT